MFQTGRKKTGGRKTGTKNKMTKARDEAVLQSGMTPLKFMDQVLQGMPIPLSVPRMPSKHKNGGDDRSHGRKRILYHPTFEDMQWAAQTAAPYKHPRLSAVRMSTGTEKSHEDWLRELASGVTIEGQVDAEIKSEDSEAEDET